MELCVATDLSPSARKAVDLAAHWAKRLGAGLHVVHIVHDPVLAPALSGDVPGDVARANVELSKLSGTLGVPCRVDVRTAEDVAGEIVEAAKQAAYLFVGSQGKSVLERIGVGSIATAVLRHSRVPVVCCPSLPKG